jgi:serpin B
MRRSFIFLFVLLAIFIGQISVAGLKGINRFVDDETWVVIWGEDSSGSLWPEFGQDVEGMLNFDPIADAGPDQTVDEGTLVTLDGSHSSDPDDGDGIASYQWAQTSGMSVTIEDDTSAKTKFTAPKMYPDTNPLIFQLTVTDTHGATDTDLCAITIAWENNSPTADAGPDQTVDRGDLVTLDGSHSSDPDDGIASYKWTQTSGLLVTLNNDRSSQASFTVPCSIPPNEVLAFQLKVSDNDGLSSSDTVEIHVSGKADGDLTQDGVVNVGDALIALRFALNLEPGHPTAEELFHGDVAPLDSNNQPNPDGQITVGDALLILQMALGINNSGGFDLAKSNKSRELSPTIDQADVAGLAEGNTEFAFDLYHKLIEKEAGNLFYSPHSISLALAMTYAGARNDTEQQMADTLNFTLPNDFLHRAFNSLDLELSSRGEGSEGQDGNGFRLNIANSIWGQKDYSFLATYLDLLAENYGAGMRLVDFYTYPDDSRVTINNWVSNETEDKIENLITPGAITSLTRLVLVNAIYFNAAWSSPFDAEMTKDGIFYLADNSSVIAPMMLQTGYFNYAEGENFQSVELRYDGNEISMVILLPSHDTFFEFEDSMTPARLTSIISSLSMKNIRLSMPKFSHKSDSISLKEMLSQMGMPDAFSSSADFSGMDGTRNLFISDVLHKAFVSVDEAGTEAAAATAAIMSLTSAPSQPIELTINRPFIFLIRDIKTGAILFMGRIVNPAI